MINRRDILKRSLAAAGLMAMPSLLSANPPALARRTVPGKGLKRVVFFMQNQGFDPLTCIPAGLSESCPLSQVKLAEPMAALEPLKNKMNIIMGLQGRHTSPSHSACFGALGGYGGGLETPPAGKTIDHVLSQNLPQTVMPHFCVGMDSMDSMRAKPTIAKLSASGASQPIYMHSDPVRLYQQIFGSIAKGDVSKNYSARSSVLQGVESIVEGRYSDLPTVEAERLEKYADGFKDINALRSRLKGIPDVLRKFAPEYGEHFSNPEFETDWHDALLDISISCLRANLSNVVTIGSGRGEIFGAWSGLGITQVGHNLGHMKQVDNDIWIKIRQYNSQMLVKLVDALENTPEVGGNGSMMDNTLIVYTSNNADKQHTNGAKWPFVLIGDAGGQFKTGQFTQVQGDRPLNDLYTTILRAAGMSVDSFNVSPSLAKKINHQKGPIEALMA